MHLKSLLGIERVVCELTEASVGVAGEKMSAGDICAYHRTTKRGSEFHLPSPESFRHLVK